MDRTRALMLVVLTLLLGCGGGSGPDRETFAAEGVVESVDRVHGQLMVAHEEIAGLMPAMTMNLDVSPASLLDGVDPGAHIRFTLERGPTTLRITSIDVIEAGTSGSVGGVAAPPPEEVAPDFELTDHEGRSFRLSELRGRAVLMDFIFTRCSGPCPLLTAAHASLQRQIPEALAERTRFVSVSLDPTYDTPRRLRAYAETRGADLERWFFLTGPPTRVREVLADYYIGTGYEPGGTLVHVVATYLIDPEGMIARRYLGLEHTADELLADLRRILSAPPPAS